MKEEFLHHAWRYRLFDMCELNTAEGETLEILHPGTYNHDAGPDFFNAQLRIGGQLWVGNVEVHVQASDWYKHGHDKDGAYDNVILHVVYAQDAPVCRSSGGEIPTLELESRLNKESYACYLQLKGSRSWIPCGAQAGKVRPVVIRAWMDRLLAERLEQRSMGITQRLQRNRNNWEETFYHLLAYNFGFTVNSEPFEQLARSLPLNLVRKMSGEREQLEALFFGQSGLVSVRGRDPYTRKLRKEYAYLRHKFSLSPMDASQWKYLRMRPVNFPVIRLSQFVHLLSRSPRLLPQVLEQERVGGLQSVLDAEASAYWDHHYIFGRRSGKRRKPLGHSSFENILINTVIPFLFTYGRNTGEERYVGQALSLLEQLPGEYNSIIEAWKELGLPVGTAGDTQALLQLKKAYCGNKRCLECALGKEILQKGGKG